MPYLTKAMIKTDIETEKELALSPRSPIVTKQTHATRIEQTAGNMALQRMFETAVLQTKLRVGSTTDPLEREADRIADAVMTTGGLLPERQPVAEETPLVQTKPAADGAEVSDGRQANIDARRGSGQPLSPADKAFFEPRFGSDFGRVRIHTDSGAAELAHSLGARAFTVGQDIFFASGESPASTTGNRRLLAHELTHMVQQRRAAPDRLSSQGTLLQRAPDTSTATPQPQTIEPATESSWRARINAAIRAQFGLTGAGMTAGRVYFLEAAAFAARFPASEIESLLLDLFLSPPIGTPVRDILRHHQMIVAASDPTAVDALRRFIADRMRIGFFEYVRRSPPTPAIRHRTDISGPAQPELQRTERITPRALVAEAVGGVTTTAGPRAARRIAVSRPARVETLVHEGCHFYVHSAFRRLANSARYQYRLFRGLRISSILMEGFAEYFARQVMRTNAADFGPIAIRAYDEEVDLVSRFITTLGEAQARQAYFQGNAAALGQLERAIELNVRAYPLLVPRFMLTAPVAAGL